MDITWFSCRQPPFRYLGIPVTSSRLKSADYGMLVNAVENKIKCWPKNTLSYAGKLELVRSVLEGVECLWLNVLPIPKNIIRDIEVICRKFVWPTKLPPIAWDTLHKPKEDGGWGLKNLVAWNKAQLAKTIWKIQEKNDSLWIKWVNMFYLSSTSIWELEPKKDYSALIKQLIIICKSIVSRIGSVDAASTCLRVWFNGKSGVAKAYEFFVNKTGKCHWKPLIWKSCLLPKHRFTLWLVAHGKLLTRDMQCYVENKVCALCSCENESVARLFFKCSFSLHIWNEIHNWPGMKRLMNHSSTLLRAFRINYRGNSVLAKDRACAVAAAFYHIWNARNRTIFEGEKQFQEDVSRRIKLVVLRCIPPMYGNDGLVSFNGLEGT